MAKPPLNARQQEFARLWAAGPPGIKHNNTKAYIAAGYHPKNDRVAGAASARLLADVRVKHEIAKLHREADAEAINKLIDWKIIAPEAQARIRSIMVGYVPAPGEPYNVSAMKNRDSAAVAQQVLRAAEMILERAYPSKIYADLALAKPADMIAAILGVSPEELPSPEDIAAYASNNGTAAHDA